MSQTRYDREFKLNAVKLYRESGRTQEDIAISLGIAKATLNGWIKEYKEHGEQSFPGSGKLKPCNEELYNLRKKLAQVTQERDILKKAMTIFSRPKKRD